MRSSPLLLPLIFTFVILSLLNNMIYARMVCVPCSQDEDCEKEPDEICTLGETRDYCNRRVCAKGPGERCGGPLGILGHCGDGMMCKADERCYGCSTRTFECYP